MSFHNPEAIKKAGFKFLEWQIPFIQIRKVGEKIKRQYGFITPFATVSALSLPSNCHTLNLYEFSTYNNEDGSLAKEVLLEVLNIARLEPFGNIEFYSSVQTNTEIFEKFGFKKVGDAFNNLRYGGNKYMQLLRGNTVELSKLHGLPPIGRVQYEVNNV